MDLQKAFSQFSGNQFASARGPSGGLLIPEAVFKSRELRSSEKLVFCWYGTHREDFVARPGDTEQIAKAIGAEPRSVRNLIRKLAVKRLLVDARGIDRARTYFIRAGLDGPIKIGTADNAAKRVSDLQTGNAEKLQLLADVPSDQYSERELHRKFIHLKIRNEWFRPGPDLMAFISGLEEVR